MPPPLRGGRFLRLVHHRFRTAAPCSTRGYTPSPLRGGAHRPGARRPDGVPAGTPHAAPTGIPDGAPTGARGAARDAFTLIELLVVIAVIGVLLSLMAPALSGAWASARQARCASNLRQLAAAWALYADGHGGRAMPLAYTDPADIGAGEPVYWWGSDGSQTGRVDHERGFIAPYLDAALAERSAFECPSQPWGSYAAQGPTGEITSTYGYNGYYLSPPKTPGWSAQIGHRPWTTLASIERPTDLFVFADTLLPSKPVRNNALLDPPLLYVKGGSWEQNPMPTTSFRHGPARAPLAEAARADGSVRAAPARPDWLTHPALRVGSAGAENGPHYVPDWRGWD